MHVCMYVCMYGCMYSMYVWGVYLTSPNTLPPREVRMDLASRRDFQLLLEEVSFPYPQPLYVCMYVCICMNVCMYVCMYVCTDL